MRIGVGYDVHQLAQNRKLILGGVEIPHHLGLLGHSDADVLTHAICDAILGAAALGDIGTHFPDTDASYAGMDSQVFLSDVGAMVREQNYIIGNVDSTIIAEKPKLAPYIMQMRSVIAKTLEISESQVNIKATTAEGLGIIGKEMAIAAQAIVCLTIG